MAPSKVAALSKALSGRIDCVQGIMAAVMVAAAAATVNYAMSGPEYRHVSPKSAITEYLISSFKLAKGGPLGPHLILQCTKKCLASDSCTSFVVHPSQGLCYLSTMDRCYLKKRFMHESEDHFYYERFDGSTPYPPTCYASCFLTYNSCDECGRPNCWGDRCEQCAATCWTRKNKTENSTYIFTNDFITTFRIHCKGNWHRWWGNDVNKTRSTPQEALVLHLILVYADKRELSSFFNSFVYKESIGLSVGNLTADEGAGNWWQAPFSNRPLRHFPDSNCRPFYTPNETCISHTTESVEKQRELYNGTVLHRGFAWLTGNQSYDSVPILHINMWVKCAQCEDENS
ncbi:uncharacterized protein LOC123515550 [Portunus trituberculatus]|uniref:uncharacterized protein LOC123515550 n=1 Tax=Portunus trituberculatus TaxID=210409 RepID=UPI001E1D0082|nr:uncharacterized protein LOC123515550 [Portunus trituberculatus]